MKNVEYNCNSKNNVLQADFAPKEKLTADKNFALQIGNVGELDTLHWEDAPVISENGVKVLVKSFNCIYQLISIILPTYIKWDITFFLILFSG